VLGQAIARESECFAARKPLRFRDDDDRRPARNRAIDRNRNQATKLARFLFRKKIIARKKN